MKPETEATQTAETPAAFVIGVVDGSVIALRRETLVRLAASWAAARSSTTWYEFRNQAGPEVMEQLEDMFDDDTRSPADDSPFDATRDIPGYAEGSWPDWPPFLMLGELPPEVAAAAGKRETWILSVDYLNIEPAMLPKLIYALDAHGYAWTRDDALAARACGY